MVSAVRFSNGQEAFSLTTAAQNIHVFLRKSPLLKEHFFEWLKTAISSTACGTVTLKSPPSRAFFVPDVHPRLRKHLARCTLDCGFQTSESPALRGFVGGLRALATAALYLAQNRMGYMMQKARQKVAKTGIENLPSEHFSVERKVLYSTAFVQSVTNGSRSLSLPKAGTYSTLREKSYTAAYTPKHGASLLPPYGAFCSRFHV